METKRHLIIWKVILVIILLLVILAIIALAFKMQGTELSEFVKRGIQKVNSGISENTSLNSTNSLDENTTEAEEFKTTTVEINEDIAKTLLVNSTHQMPANYWTGLVIFDNMPVSSLIVNDLNNMYKAAAQDGIRLKINSAYRSRSEQEKLVNNRIAQNMQAGLSKEEATAKTLQLAQKPGYSEHETGLAIDFSNTSNVSENNPMWTWLYNNAYKYGFILRYPSNKANITKVSYEQWHYRYVGKQAALEMKQSGECLEEYLSNN